MLSGKDISIDKEGSIILNGDKYPLASQAEIEDVKDDVTALETVTDGLTNTIGDITQTGITGADVAAQLGVLNAAIGTKQDAINNLSYSTTGLTPNANCSIKAGGYIQIGKLVIVNIRVVVTAVGAAITGLPIPAISDTNNGVGGTGYNSSDGSTGGFFINNTNGTLNVSNNVASGDILFSFVYAAN